MIGDLVFDEVMGSHGIIVGFIPEEESIRTPFSPKQDMFEVLYQDSSIQLVTEEHLVWIARL